MTDDKARAQKVNRQTTDRARLVRSIARKVTNSAEIFIENNGQLEGFDVHMKICEIMDAEGSTVGRRWDRNDWDWDRMENDVRRLTGLYLTR